jgi:hypothetical protein
MRTWRSIALLSLALSACNDHRHTRAKAEGEGGAAIEQAVVAATYIPEISSRLSKVEVRIHVRDQASGKPVAGAIIDDLGYMGRSTGDDGVYAGSALIGGPYGAFSIRCRGKAFTAGEILAKSRYTVLNNRIDLVVDVDAGRCGPPPSKLRARFAGMYVHEFESSHFFPCDGLPEVSAKRFHPADGIWTEIPEAIEDGLIWAQLRERMFGMDDGFYIELTGTLTGPGSYGHLGTSLYELDVETIHDTSDRRPASCIAPGYAVSRRMKAEYTRKQSMQTQG